MLDRTQFLNIITEDKKRIANEIKQIDEIIDLLEGKTEKILRDLDTQMHEASQKLAFEKAAYLWVRKIAIERASANHKVSNISENNIDVIGLYKSEIEVCIEIFFVRKSKMVGRDNFFLEDMQDESDRQILTDFVKQYYVGREILPNKIILKEEIEEKELIEEWLTKEAGRKEEIKTPQKGEKMR